MPLVFEVGYQPRKEKNHAIRNVFQYQAMYVRTSFRGAKTNRIGKKGMFWSYRQIVEMTCTQIKKNACKNVYLGSILIPEKYVVMVCFGSPFTRMISSLKYKSPPPPGLKDF